MTGVQGRGRTQHTNVSAGSCSLPERFFPALSAKHQPLSAMFCPGGLLRTALHVPALWAMPAKTKPGFKAASDEFVFSSEATSCRDASQGVRTRYFHSVCLPLLQNQTYIFCSC